MLDQVVRESLVSAGAENGVLVVAVSGGRDSVVLFDVLQRLAPSLCLTLSVAHVNHGLRGDASDEDQRFVEALAAAAGVPCWVRRIDPEAERVGKTSRSRPTLEEAARNLRRDALRAIAEEVGAGWIATAHHLGDQAETVLLRILRGTSPAGLAAMAPVDSAGRIIRPLLDTPPEQIARAATDAGLAWREDASNLERRFARNRLRHDWMPQLAAAFDANLLRNLGNLAEAERQDLEWIEGLVDAAAKERIEVGPDGIRIAIDGWDQVPEALARRLVRRVLVEAGLARELSRAHLARVLEFLRRGRTTGRNLRLELPAGIELRRRDDFFLVAPRDPSEGIGSPQGATLPRRD